MAEHEHDKEISSEPSAQSSEPAKASDNELPAVDSPSLSPAGEAADEAPADAPAEVPANALITLPTPIIDEPREAPAADAAGAGARFRFTPRQKRSAMLAASVAIAAGLGAIIGAFTGGAFSPTPHSDVAALEERKAMQQSIAHLSKQVATLKANLDKAEKSTQSQVSKVAKLAERLDHKSSEDIVTGSISKPATIPTPAAAPTPMPTPRPVTTAAAPVDQVGLPAISRAAPHGALASNQPIVVRDWFIRNTEGAYIYVEGHGEIYQVVPGADLPGLGPVQSIKRQDGRWVVLTPRGIIVSMRDRRFFE